MTLPNFLIVGAAKAGTTAFAQMLGRHPDVFVTPRKESSFFLYENDEPAFTGPGDDYFDSMVVTLRAEYEALFATAGRATAIGEASVYYLCRPDVFARIDDQLPGVRVVALLRNPTDRAFSHYAHMVRDGREPERSFAHGLALEDARVEEGWEYSWHYRRLGCYSRQVEGLYDQFGRERVHLIRYDDLVSDPASVLRATFAFLGVDAGAPVDATIRSNPSGLPRSRFVHRFLSRPNLVKRAFAPIVPDELGQSVYRYLHNRNLRPIVFPPAVRLRLQRDYAPEVERLAVLTGLDLDAWLPARWSATVAP